MYLNNITGKISATATNENGHAAAISTQLYNPATNTWDDSDNFSDDNLYINEGANIIGDIRLGKHYTNSDGTPESDGDTITFNGSTTFNHDLYGVETITIEDSSYPYNSGDTITLNLASVPNANDYQRNTVHSVTVDDYTLAVSNLQTTNLTVKSNASLAFNLINPDNDGGAPAITVTENTSLSGTLKINVPNADALQAGDLFKLIHSNADILSEFDDFNDTLINDSLGYRITSTVDSTGETINALISLIGDVNNDNKITQTDYDRIAKFYNYSYSKFTWFDGDFNNDGKVNDADLALMTHNTGLTLNELRSKMIPEPTTALLSLLTFTPLLSRRRRNR